MMVRNNKIIKILIDPGGLCVPTKVIWSHQKHLTNNGNFVKSTFSRLEARKRKSFVVRDIVSVSPNFCSTYKG